LLISVTYEAVVVWRLHNYQEGIKMFNSLLTQFHDAAPLPQITMDDAKSFIELFCSGEQYFQTFSDGDDL